VKNGHKLVGRVVAKFENATSPRFQTGICFKKVTHPMWAASPNYHQPMTIDFNGFYKFA
jgi:hypothetical protein